MTSRYILFLILGIDAIVLFFQTSQLSISHNEASLVYESGSFLSILVRFSLDIFGQNDFGLRFVMILFHLLSVVLIYLVSKKYISFDKNRVWLVLIFVLLPGNLSASVVVNDAGIVIFGLFLFIYLYEKIPQLFLNVLLLFYSMINISFAYLFLGLAVYYIHDKKVYNFLYVIFLYSLTSFLYGFEISGIPTGHFLDLIGVYSAIFTPIIFIYIFYTLYRRYLILNIDLLWFVSSTALIISLVLSFRQRVSIEYFAPYLMLALPLATQLFISSYRVRLKRYRTSYRLMFTFSLLFLILNTLIVLFNKELYVFIENPKKHFAYDVHVAKELAKELKDKNIFCVTTNYKMQNRLKFYGVDKCQLNSLVELDLDTKKESTVTVSYRNRVVYKANVTKINNI